MRLAFTILLATFLPLIVYPQVHIVDNNPNAPGGTNHYSTLSAAIIAASAGDTIYIVPSSTSYGNLDFNKQLVIFGGGFYPEGEHKKASVVNYVYVRSSATSGSLISSLYVLDEIYLNTSNAADAGNISDLSIRNCYIDERIESYVRSTDTLRNLNIRGNIMGANEDLQFPLYLRNAVESAAIQNNILIGWYTSIYITNSVSPGGIQISNNIFLGDGTEYAFQTLNGATINNNIFYGRSPESQDSTNFSGNTFLDNISYSTFNDFNSVNNNLFNVRNYDEGGNITADPQFVNLPISNVWKMLYDVNVQATEATSTIPNIGVYTGSSDTDYFTKHGSWLPSVLSFSGASEIIEGNNLQLIVTTNGNDAVNASILRTEYFIDGPDPGFGSGTDTGFLGPVVSPAVDTIIFSTSGLSPGFHSLFTRAENDFGIWGNYQEYVIYVNEAVSSSVPDVTGMEYFFNNDPGYGNGISLTVSPSTQVDISEVISTATMPLGFHTLYVRAQDGNGNWGIAEARLIYVDDASNLIYPDISSIEYFFDTDPGYGSGTPFTVSPDSIVNINEAIATNSLAPGFHTLYIRAMDSNNSWGLMEARLIYIEDASTSAIPDITEAEYFFDSDPGYGMGTAFTITPDSVVNIEDIIATGSLTTGFHTLFVRAMDATDRWGIAEARLIYIDAPAGALIPDITAVEYFFDTDPGYGSGTPFTVAPDSIVNISEAITTNSLAPGFHTLYIRAKDASERWGLLESRLIFVDETSDIAIPNVEVVEYFFDSDPGYGLATEISISSPATLVELTETISTASLTTGFHTLYLRAKDASGRWGLLESRLIYVDENNVTAAAPISALEYFFDTDPGYGNGTQIPVTPADSIKLAWNVSSFSLGTHLLGVRVKNTDDTWSMTEMFKFRVYSEGRELDSAAIVEIYEKNGGSTWTNKTNWISANSIDTWFGVTLDPVTGRVTDLNLINNNLTGDLAKEFGYILDLENADLSYNKLTDTIPSTTLNLVNLQSLDLVNNDLNGLPDLSNIASLINLHLDSNFFEFGDIEPLVGISQLTYQNQELLRQGYDSAVSTEQTIDLVINTTGANNQYQWFKDSLSIEGATSALFSIPSLGIYDVGDYHVEVTNSVATNAVIMSDIYRLYFDGPTSDSLALVALYDSLGGTNWTNQANWKTGPVSSWAGVFTDQNSRVRKVALFSNNLTGILPPRIGDLTMLDSLVLSENNISGQLPGEFLKMTMLDYVDLSNNDITNIPNNIKTSIPGITTLTVEGNRLQFGPLETNLAISNFTFIPQDSVLAPMEKTAVIGGKASFRANVTGANNMYQWFKDGTAISGANVDSLIISNIDFTDEGLYQVRVQNSLIGGLTLFTTNTRLVVQGLAADQNALEEFYNTNGGANWTTNTGWLADTIINWHGVVVRDKRVVEVNLPDNNITGELSSRIADLTALEKLDLSGNHLRNLPDLTDLSVLSSLDVSRNMLEFAPLERNISITGMVYSTQDSVGSGFIDTLAVHSAVKLSGVVSGTSNNYQWYFEETAIDGATLDSLEIPDLTRQEMGKYYVQVTNDLVPDLTLVGRIKEILASASISGTITDDDANTITDGGRMILLRITDLGGYDTTAIVDIMENGTYSFNDVVLFNYQLIAEADSVEYPNHLPTYYEEAIFWEEADTIKLADNLPNTDIEITIFEDLSLGGEGEISGYIEEEDGESGKTMKRKRVANAGVSVRRKVRAGRKKLIEKSRILQDTELVGHVKTNKDGRFAFTDLENDLYYFNVQYPGVPMDSSSFIEIPVGDVAGGRTTSYHDKVEVEALIDENKITVRQINITSVYQNEVYAKIKVYPNPAEDHFTLDMQGYQEVFIMTLIDEQGKIILYQREVEGLIEIPVNTLSKGIYVLRLLNQDGQPVTTKRIAIQ